MFPSPRSLCLSLSLSLSFSRGLFPPFDPTTFLSLSLSPSTGLDSGEVVAVVEEPRVNRLRVVPVDDYWQPFSVPRAERERAAGMQESANDGVALPPSTVARELPYFKRGQPLNMGVDGRKAMRDVMAVGIYDNCQVQLKDVAPPAGSSSAGGGDGGDDDDDDDGAGEGGGSSSSSRRKAKQQQNLGPQLVDVEILVHERPHKTARPSSSGSLRRRARAAKGGPRSSLLCPAARCCSRTETS